MVNRVQAGILILVLLMMYMAMPFHLLLPALFGWFAYLIERRERTS